MTISVERKAALNEAYEANIAIGNAPYANVAICNQEELAWIFETRGWSSEWFLPAGKSRADLTDADLRSADLRSADLRSANLRSADLTRADLRDADLRSADLRSADLRSADLRSADLTRADLTDANLRDADLTDANLRSADLTRADLTDADLRSADLRSVEADIIAALDAAPLDTEYLLHALERGEVDGSMYEEPGAPCACLKGTQVISAAKRLNCSLSKAAEAININKSASSPAERWFIAIHPGDTPENSAVVAWTVNVVKRRLAFYDLIARIWTPCPEATPVAPTAE